MTLKPTLPPKSQPPMISQRHRPAIGRLAHEVINQLTVISLVGARIVARGNPQSGSAASREAEIFTRSIQETTLLAQQLADHISSREDLAKSEAESIRPPEGQLVRLLRDVTDRKS